MIEYLHLPAPAAPDAVLHETAPKGGKAPKVSPSAWQQAADRLNALLNAGYVKWHTASVPGGLDVWLHKPDPVPPLALEAFGMRVAGPWRVAVIHMVNARAFAALCAFDPPSVIPGSGPHWRFVDVAYLDTVRAMLSGGAGSERGEVTWLLTALEAAAAQDITCVCFMLETY